MSLLEGQRLYVDANCFIYLSERHSVFGPPARRLFKAAHDGFCTLVTSDLTLAEVLVLPIRLGDEAMQAQYVEAVSPRDALEVRGVTRAILIESARLRATTGSKLPDAIHVATAISAGCSAVVTEDRGIRAPAGLRLVRVSELGSLLPPDTP